MAATISTITDLIGACPAPVSTAEGVSTAITWLNSCVVFCDIADANKIPTKTDIAVRAQSYADNTPTGALSSYTELNDRLLHIKLMLGGVTAVID